MPRSDESTRSSSGTGAGGGGGGSRGSIGGGGGTAGGSGSAGGGGDDGGRRSDCCCCNGIGVQVTKPAITSMATRARMPAAMRKYTPRPARSAAKHLVSARFPDLMYMYSGGEWGKPQSAPT